MNFISKQRSKRIILAVILVVFSLCAICGCAQSSSNTTDVTLDGEVKQTTNEAEQRECKHSYKLASTTEPTCTAMGVSVYVCEHCESSREENVAALGHQKKTVPAKEGNCTEFGLSEGEICSRCNITLKAQQQTWKQEHNHDFADGYCTRCLERQSIEVSKYTLSEDKKSYILSVGGFTSEIKVRETFNGLPVSDIDLKALTSLNFVEKIIISDSVSQNKSSLFYGIKVLKTKTSGNLKYFASDNNDQFILVKCTNQSVSNINIAEGTEIIAPGAFSGCKSLKSVSLPSTIKRIERAAFEYCSALGSIDIPNGTEYIGGYAFYGCTSLTELHFPDSVTEIGTNAMQSCSSLKTVTLSRSLDKISDGLFNLCSSLKKVTMHEGIKRIESFAFSRCSLLEELHIPNSVTKFYPNSLDECRSLKVLSIGDGITTLTDAHTPISLPSVTHLSIGASYRGGFEAFRFGDKIESITVSEKNPNYKTVDGVLLNGKGTEILLYPVGKTDAEYTVPHGVTTIKKGTFNSSPFKKLIIADTVTKIEAGAVSNCKNLNTVIMSSSIIELEAYAFADCTINYNVYQNGKYLGSKQNPYVLLVGPARDNVNSITLHPDTRSIAASAFDFCTTLKSVYFSNKLVGIGASAFKQTNITSAIIPDSVTFIGEEAFGLCFDLTTAKIPQGITEIPNLMFNSCSNLKSVGGMHEGITKIGASAFIGCDTLTSMQIPSSVRYIGERAFYSCDALKLLIIPEGVTTIYGSTFLFDDSLTLVIPKSMKKIDACQFERGYDASLPIYYMGSKEDWTKISINSDRNAPLMDASRRYYYSEQEPTESGNWWHYVDGVPTKW